MKKLLLRLLLVTMCVVAAASAHAQQGDWGNFVFVSSTLGNNGNKLCLGEGSRGSDIGCPAYAPYVSNSGNVGIGTTTPTTQLQISGTATMNVTRLISQTISAVAGGGGDRIVSGTTTASIYTGGMLVVSSSGGAVVSLRPVSGSSSALEVGQGQPGNGYAYVDLTADATYTDYGLRIMRDITGPNANSTISHRGTGSLILSAPDAGSIYFQTSGSNRLSVSSAGVITIGAYGAGTLSTNASGVITASSDERLKDIQGDYTRGLAALTKLTPITYRWTKASGLDDGHAYSGFSAQDVQKAIPEAVSADSKGYLTLQDRPLIAASVNAIKELKAENDKLAEGLKAANDNIAAMRAELKFMQAGKK